MSVHQDLTMAGEKSMTLIIGIMLVQHGLSVDNVPIIALGVVCILARELRKVPDVTEKLKEL